MAADDTKPLEGATTVDDKIVFEAQRLSYEAARTIAEKIARRISERTKGHRVVIANAQLLADVSNLVAMKVALRELADGYDALVAPPPAPDPNSIFQSVDVPHAVVSLLASVNPAVAAATAGVQGALSLIGLFRQNVDYKGVPISIDALAFEVELAARLRMHKASEVIVPDFAVFSAPSSDGDGLLSLLGHVKSTRAKAVDSIAQRRPAVVDSVGTIEPTRKADDKTESKADDKAEQKPGGVAAPPPKPDPMLDALAFLDKRFDDFETQILKADTDGSGLTMLARLFRVETLTAEKTMFVFARVVLAGGNNRVQRSLWRTIWEGDGLSSTGGAVVTWAILNVRGAVEDGGVFSESMSAASPKPPEIPPAFA